MTLVARNELLYKERIETAGLEELPLTMAKFAVGTRKEIRYDAKVGGRVDV